MVKRQLGKTQVINVSRKVIYSLQAIEQGNIIFNADNEMEVSNRSDSTAEERLVIEWSKDYPTPDVLVDGAVLNPTEVSPTAPGQVMRVYHMTIPPGHPKKVNYKGQKFKSPLPYKDIDVTPRPTLSSELVIEGPSDVMSKLNIEAQALTWRDNWEKAAQKEKTT